MEKKLFPLPASVLELLKDEERAATVLYTSLAGIGCLAFVAAVLAILFMPGSA